jgi:hypothetical protein
MIARRAGSVRDRQSRLFMYWKLQKTFPGVRVRVTLTSE